MGLDIVGRIAVGKPDEATQRPDQFVHCVVDHYPRPVPVRHPSAEVGGKPLLVMIRPNADLERKSLRSHLEPTPVIAPVRKIGGDIKVAKTPLLRRKRT
jgi:hypothetical protein